MSNDGVFSLLSDLSVFLALRRTIYPCFNSAAAFATLSN